MSEEKKRGGPGRGQGRKPVKAGEETVTVSLRMTKGQRDKLARLGGAEWVRGKIDRARDVEPVAECGHEWRCVNDGKHGRDEVWACIKCGVSEHRGT